MKKGSLLSLYYIYISNYFRG